jgi:hypothetical protein
MDLRPAGRRIDVVAEPLLPELVTGNEGVDSVRRRAFGEAERLLGGEARD